MTNEIQWIDIVKRNQSVLFASFITKADNRKYCLDVGIDYALNDYKYVDSIVSYSERDMGALFQIFQERLEKEAEFLPSFAKTCYDQCSQLIEKSKDISRMKDLDKLDNLELKEIFEEYAEEAFKLLPFLYSGNVIEINLEQEVANGVKSLLEREEDLDKYLPILIIPSKENVIVTEMNELLEIGSQFQQKPAIVQLFEKPVEEVERELPRLDREAFDMLSNHAKEFGWLHQYSGYLGSPMTIEGLIQRLKIWIQRGCDKELAKRQKQKKEREEQFNEVVAKFGIKGRLLETIHAARDFIDVRMHRINTYFIAHYHIRNLLEEIASRIGASYEDLLFMTYEEIIDSLDSGVKPDLDEIAQRKKGYALVMINGVRKVLSGEDIQQVRKSGEVEDYTKITELKGSTACMGETVAKGKIVFDITDIDKVEEGDIVVSPMTSPDVMPALEKASGIVCDEGGILSHAAIVSRELGIPCILATEIGTKVIKDGETIKIAAGEVEGTVSLIDRLVA